MNKKAKYKDLLDGETGKVKRITWLAAESELTPATLDIAWGVDALKRGNSISVGIQEKDGKGQLKISSLPNPVKKGKPSHNAMMIAREIQGMLVTTTGSYVINKGLDGQLTTDKTFHTNRSPRVA